MADEEGEERPSAYTETVIIIKEDNDPIDTCASLTAMVFFLLILLDLTGVLDIGSWRREL